MTKDNNISNELYTFRRNIEASPDTDYNSLYAVDWVTSWLPDILEEISNGITLRCRIFDNLRGTGEGVTWHGGDRQTYADGYIMALPSKSFVICFCDHGSFIDGKLDIEFPTSSSSLGQVVIRTGYSYFSYSRNKTKNFRSTIHVDVSDILDGITKENRDKTKKKFIDAISPSIDIIKTKNSLA